MGKREYLENTGRNLTRSAHPRIMNPLLRPTGPYYMQAPLGTGQPPQAERPIRLANRLLSLGQIDLIAVIFWDRNVRDGGAAALLAYPVA